MVPQALGEALGRNVGLTDLEMAKNPIGDDGTTLAEMREGV
jgi:hypothetical protein